MKQKQFETEHAALYRRLCQCLALCGQRGYSPTLANYLQTMVADCHRRLYGSALQRPNTLVRWMTVDFPCRVRAEWRLLLLACIAFAGVAIGVGLLVWYQPHWAYSFASP